MVSCVLLRLSRFSRSREEGRLRVHTSSPPSRDGKPGESPDTRKTRTLLLSAPTQHGDKLLRKTKRGPRLSEARCRPAKAWPARRAPHYDSQRESRPHAANKIEATAIARLQGSRGEIMPPTFFSVLSTTPPGARRAAFFPMPCNRACGSRASIVLAPRRCFSR